MSHQPPGVRHRTAVEHRVFALAVLVGIVHAADDAVVHRQPGVPLGQHLAALAAVLLAGTTAAWAYPRLRPGLRSAVALVGGTVTAANGALHVLHISLSSAQAGDLTGVAAFLAGVVLVGLGVVVPIRHRGEHPAAASWRWARRAIAVVLGVLVAQVVVVPVVVGLVQTHKFREDVGAPPAGFDPVTFRSSDGLLLTGWYHPSGNGAAVVVVNSAAGDRSGSKAHASLLARHGYGVLTYDARGTGRSDGSPNGWGWGWDDDVAGALDFLHGRPDVEQGRIGGLGLSTGADVLLEVAADDPTLGAVVADGATGRSFADRPQGLLDAPAMWTMFAAGRLFSGTAPGPPLVEVVADAAPTPILLVASGSLPGELAANERYAAAGASTVLWRLPRVTHTKAIHEVPAEYERRVLEHLDSVLLGSRGGRDERVHGHTTAIS
jgi:dienelactone hydrolase